MSKQIPEINPELAEWLQSQPVFFVGTAPLSADGHVNTSPKGGDCFRVLGPKEVAYLDYTGSGAETVAHLRENGRIILMFCAFTGRPEIVRLHGRGEVVTLDNADYAGLAAHIPANPGARAVIHVQVERISASCGFAVPLMDLRAGRDTLDKWAASKGQSELESYVAEKNARSIDGLPAFAHEP
jgi:hypothetical protein